MLELRPPGGLAAVVLPLLRWRHPPLSEAVLQLLGAHLEPRRAFLLEAPQLLLLYDAEAVALHVRYKNVGVADGLITARIDTYFENLSKTLSRQLYGALQNAVKDDETLAEMLADEDAEDG